MTASPASKQQFYFELSKLLGAGFGIREAARMLGANDRSAASQEVVKSLLCGLEDGQSIAASLGKHAGFSSLETAILDAGEKGGRLAEAMRHLADYFGLLASTRREMLRGLIHPVLALHLGVFVATVPTAMVSGEASPLRMAGSFFGTLLGGYAIAFLAALGWRRLERAARTGEAADRFLRRIPILGVARRNRCMAGFTRVYHTCLMAGIPMRETLASAARASQSGLIVHAAARIDPTLAAGHPIGADLAGEAAFPQEFALSYATGEAAGTLDKDLDRWALHYQSEAEATIRLAAVMLPKAAYLAAALFVAWKIVAFFHGYYSGILKELE